MTIKEAVNEFFGIVFTAAMFAVIVYAMLP